MTDQIEKLREDFELFIVNKFEVTNPTAEKRRDSGEYFYAHVQLAWIAWCEAKRNMPVVELPNPELCFTSSPSGHGAFAYVHLEPLIERLEKAGIEWISESPYPVKGE
jgi:hypothetical protein